MFKLPFLSSQKQKAVPPQIMTNSLPNNLIPIEALKSIFLSLDEGIIALDNNDRIVFANKAACHILNSSLQKIVGQKADEVIKIKDQPNQREIKSIQTENLSYFGLHRILILRDLTQEKNLEQMEIDFVSMASHEFRTPLTTIKDYLAVLQEEASPTLKKEYQEFITRAYSASQELSKLVDNLLNVSKIERGSLAISLKRFNYQKSLTEIVEENKIIALKKNIQLTLKLPSQPLPEVIADEIRIDEALNNLISNAINYTKENGTVTVRVKVKDKMIITAVSDTGIGIAKEVLPHLFQKFYRGPQALREVYKGSGLGLYITKSIIDLHHGQIWVESEVGKGSTFYFSLPTAESLKTTSTIVELTSS